ncbi:MAG: ribonuclease R [Saprospiraceae bacterium]
MKRKKFNKSFKGLKLTTKELDKAIIKFFKTHPKKRLNAKQLISKLKISNNKDSVNHALKKMQDNGVLYMLEDGRYRLDKFNNASNKSSTPRTKHIGIVDVTRKGSAYIVCEDLEEDVYVAEKNLGGALNGDKVQIEKFTPRGRRRPEGIVNKVIVRSIEHFVGTIYISKKTTRVVPDRLDVPFEVLVRVTDTAGAEDGDKVVVKVTEWPVKKHHQPFGYVTTVLGSEGGNDMEMNSILINHGFNITFPEPVDAEANALSTTITKREVAKRRDMRETITFTIDPDTAKDFDDALSLKWLEDGAVEIGIHIADVSHYVKPGTFLDEEAFKRSTSVYLVDRVAPMLPEMLSNELCSLRPHEDKLTFSAVFKFDKKGKVTDRWFGKTVIHSDRRFTYEEAQDVIETKKGDHEKEMLKMNEIAKKLRKKKFKEGAIAFESDEVKFKLDEDGKPISLYVKERKDAHMLVEDFMLLANREVATYIVNKSAGHEIPFVYRVHDTPDPDRVGDLALFAKAMGYEMNYQTPQQIAESYNQLSKAAKSDEGLKMLLPMAIRTMAKAIYTTDNIGHYGLGFDNYSHFTSPIRRYADVLVHRILEKNLIEPFRVKKAILEEKCAHISNQERKAMTAERESIKYKQVEFMMEHIGQVFEGRVSGMIDKGLFIELIESRCEGMVPFDTLEDRYDVAESRLRAVGRRTKEEFKMGQRVMVEIVDADLERREIEMELVEAVVND